MRYIVDGYNLMYTSEDHQPFRDGKNLEGCRATLMEKLARFAEAEETAVTVVFDAQEGGSTKRHGEIEVVFAAGEGGADAEIVRRVEDWPNRKNLTVVSSDREVVRAVTRLGAIPVRSGVFMKRLMASRRASAPQRGGENEKEHEPDAAETEFWLRFFNEKQRK